MYAYKYRVALCLRDLEPRLHIKRFLAPLVVCVSVIEKHILGARHNASDTSGAERGAKLLCEREIYVLFKNSVNTYRAAVLAAVPRVYHDSYRAFSRRFGDSLARLTCRIAPVLCSFRDRREREEKQKYRKESQNKNKKQREMRRSIFHKYVLVAFHKKYGAKLK